MNAIQLLYASTAAFLGLLLGSFFNVAAIRVAQKESIVYPPSHCVHCNHSLKAIDLVPVFSYVWLIGKCRYCRARISPIYPIGELLTALVFFIITWQSGPKSELAVGLCFAGILIICMLSDIRHMLIPDAVVFPGMLLIFALRLWIHPLPVWNYVAAFFIGGALLYGIAFASVLLLKKEGMGGGDIKLFALIGLALGIKLTFVTLFLASLLGTLYGVLQMISGTTNRERHLPFGPFIAAGAITAYLWGRPLLDAYMNLLIS